MRTIHLYRFPMALLLLAALLLPTACVSEPLVEPGSGGDGKTTRLTLSVRGSAPQSRSLTPAQEEQIDNLHILVFDREGTAITNEHFAGLAIKGTGSLSFETLPGTDRQIVVIANGDVNDDTNGKLDAALRKVTTLDELKAVLVGIKGTGLARTDRLTMVGSTTVTITKPHAATIPVALHYLAAKVTVTVRDAISSPLLGITITGWDVVNIPKRTFLCERTGEGPQDAVTGTRPGDYLATTGKYEFEQKDDALKTWSQHFYLFENRRGTRVDREDPPSAIDKYPGMSVDDTDQRGKAWYAPPGATYLLIYGTHQLNGQTNNIVYKIYLGENPVNDYNLCRGRHYRYNVTINGLNDINVDTNVEWDSASFSVDASDNLLMDAHPDFRVFRIGGTAVDAVTHAYATVQVLEPDGITPCTWLTLSPLNLYRHGIRQPGNEHQQFAPGDGAGSFVRPKYTAAPTAESTLANCTFGMTRRLTRISFEQPTVYTYQNVILYADALDIPDTERRAKVKITYYKGPAGDEVAGERTFDIIQQGPIQVSANLLMERYEESAMLMHPGLASGLQGTEIMQWGYNTAMLYTADDRYSNGNYLTANAVYNTLAQRREMAAPEWTATGYAAYREKYPRQGGQVTEPSSMPTLGAPYYYPEMTGATPVSSYFHPIFNASAARYCHEKNRDTNGDGIISQEETVWYLPSYADMIALKKNPSASARLTGTYWTSTEEESGKSWAITLPKGTMVVADKTTTYQVRCVRGSGTVIPEATMESEESDKTKINLSPGAGANGVFKITDDKDFGFSWAVTSNAPDWLTIATDAKGTAGETAKTGAGDATLYAYASDANESASKRTATLTLTHTRISTVKTIVATQSIFPIIKGEKSNCYMVAPETAVDIPVERANESHLSLTGSVYDETTKTYHQLQASTAWHAELVWESAKGLVTLSKITGTGASGCFRVAALNHAVQGNAVVAIKNANNEILWSWHIWVTDYDGTSTFETNDGKRNIVFMDRALGALSTTPGDVKSCGLYYQWGRKDPFPGLGQQGGSWTITNKSDPIRVYNAQGIPYAITRIQAPDVSPNNLTNVIRNPDTYYFSIKNLHDWFTINNANQNHELWSGNPTTLVTAAPKSVFDPCPQGWRVVPWLNNVSPFEGMMSGVSFSIADKGATWSGTGGYFPASGFREKEGIHNIGTEGYSWSASSSGIYSYFLMFSSKGSSLVCGDRANGFPLRCSQDNL